MTLRPLSPSFTQGRHWSQVTATLCEKTKMMAKDVRHYPLFDIPTLKSSTCETDRSHLTDPSVRPHRTQGPEVSEVSRVCLGASPPLMSLPGDTSDGVSKKSTCPFPTAICREK